MVPRQIVAFQQDQGNEGRARQGQKLQGMQEIVHECAPSVRVDAVNSKNGGIN